MNKLKLFLTQIIWGRKLTVIEGQVLSVLNRKLDNVIVISKDGKFLFDGGGSTIGSLTLISGTIMSTQELKQVSTICKGASE